MLWEESYAVVKEGVRRLVGSQKYKKVQAGPDCATTTTTDGIWEALDFATGYPFLNIFFSAVSGTTSRWFESPG